MHTVVAIYPAGYIVRLANRYTTKTTKAECAALAGLSADVCAFRLREGKGKAKRLYVYVITSHVPTNLV